jgi:hypothetical protein
MRIAAINMIQEIGKSTLIVIFIILSSFISRSKKRRIYFLFDALSAEFYS